MPGTVVHIAVLPSAADIAIDSKPKNFHLVRIPGDRDERRTGSDRVGNCNSELSMPGAVVHIVVAPSAADIAIDSKPKNFLVSRISTDHDERRIAANRIGNRNSKRPMP